MSTTQQHAKCEDCDDNRDDDGRRRRQSSSDSRANFVRPASYDSIATLAPNATNWPFEFALASSRPPDIAFFDLETTIPIPGAPNQRIIDFGAIVVDPITLVVKKTLSQLIYNDAISERSAAINKISADAAKPHGTFDHHADAIFEILDGRVWAGHNIVTFDVPRLCYEFGLLGRAMPRCAGIIDTYAVFAAWKYDRVMDVSISALDAHASPSAVKLGDEQPLSSAATAPSSPERRSVAVGSKLGKLKLDTLGKWFGLQQEAHRALPDAIESFRVLLAGCASSCFAALVEKGIAARGRGTVASGSPTIPPTSSFVFAGGKCTVENASSGGRDDGTEQVIPTTVNSAKRSVTASTRAKLSGRTDVGVAEMLGAPALVATPSTVSNMSRYRYVDRKDVPASPFGAFEGGAPAKTMIAACVEWKREKTPTTDGFASLRREMVAAGISGPFSDVVIGVAVQIGYRKDDKLYGTYLIEPHSYDDRYVDASNLWSFDADGRPVKRTFRFDRIIWCRLVIIVPEPERPR